MSFEAKKAMRTSLTQFLHYNPCFRQRPHVRKIFERGGSLEQLNQDGFLNNLLLQTVPVEPSSSTLTPIKCIYRETAKETASTNKKSKIICQID